MAQEFRSSKNYKEIMQIIERSQTVGGSFLWQNIGEKRVTLDIHVRTIDPVSQKFEIEFLSDPKELVQADPCFIKIPINESAFKSTIITLKGRIAVLDFPFAMVLAENRDQKRIVFRDEDAKTAIIRNPSSSDPLLSTTGLTLSVANVSKTGLCVAITAVQNSRINVNDVIQINALGTFKFAPPLSASVVRKVPYEKRNQFGTATSGIHVGIKLAEPISPEIFEQYTYSDVPIVFNDERLFKDQAFRESVKIGMKKTLDKILEKQNLKKLFEKLDVKREGNDYLKNHIEILCEVVCQVGKIIGWVSETNLDKLIYVAYLHDVRYFDRPHLARVQDKQELEIKKNKVNPDDLTFFTEGPAYAAELAKGDFNNHPDAPKILLQHRELPNGKGFPTGMKGSQFSPLSCLFIVCHEFVDYIIDVPDWSYADFLARYRRVYTGTYFHKVFQVFDDLK